MNSLVVDAIRARKLMSVYYNGGERTIEPHCYGVSKANNELLRLYQIDGYSSKGELGWKLFKVKNILSIKILDENFASPRPEYKKNDKVMKRVFAQL